MAATIISFIDVLSFLGLNNPHTTSRLWGMLTGIFSKENSLKLATIAAPPPLFVSLGVDMYLSPSIWKNFSYSNCCFLQLAFSHTSERMESEIFLSKMSFLKFPIFGIRDRTFDTDMIGSASPSTNFLSLFRTFLLNFDSFLSIFLGS